MKKNVLFIFPACNTKTFGSNDGRGATSEKTISPPLGILYLATELIGAGYNVEAVDYNAEQYSDENLIAYIKTADIVGISMLSFNRDHSYDIIDKIKLLQPDLPVIVGGPDCMLHPRPIPGTVLTVCHEAENIIVMVIDAVLRNKDLSLVPGIIYRDIDNLVKNGAPYKYNRNLNTIKYPTRKLLRDNKGYSVIGKRASRKITTIITSRGCPKRCVFCAHRAIAYQKYRVRSVHNVLEEVRQIAEEGYKIVGIVDDNFTADRERATRIMEGIRDMNLGLSFAVQGRVDAADFELYSLMREAGVKGITFGLESGNQDVLDFYNKGVTVEQNRNAIYLADKAGLYTGGIFILGAPMETKEHFKKTYTFAIGLPLDITSFWVLDYTYGSTLWEDAHIKGKVKKDEYNIPAGKERGTAKYPTQEMEKIAESFFFRFYSRPSYWIRQVSKVIRIRDQYYLRVLFIGIFWLIIKRFKFLSTSFMERISCMYSSMQLFLRKGVL